MEQIVLIIHLLIALAIIGLIMLQQGKGADMGASFGAGASQTLFGADGGGNVLTKATALLVVGFFVTSFGLAIIAKNKTSVAVDVDVPMPVMEEQVVPAEIPAANEDLPTLESDVPVEASGDDDLPELD